MWIMTLGTNHLPLSYGMRGISSKLSTLFLVTAITGVSLKAFIQNRIFALMKSMAIDAHDVLSFMRTSIPGQVFIVIMALGALPVLFGWTHRSISAERNNLCSLKSNLGFCGMCTTGSVTGLAL